MENYTHAFIAPKLTAFIIPALFVCLMAVMLVVGVVIMHNMKNTGISVGDGFLTVKSLFYGRKIPIGDIDLNGVKSLNLRDERNKDYKVSIRTNGIGLPGYLVGWMRLHNGHKALVYITDKTNVALIPTTNFDVLVSTDDFEGLRNALGK
ncbi:hypothetical protein R80B4_00917 [Fibrobacteres bacterium R8-0-B4]